MSIRLLALPGINVTLAADLAGEMGPMHRYIDPNAITRRAGLYRVSDAGPWWIPQFKDAVLYGPDHAVDYEARTMSLLEDNRKL